MQGKRIIIGIDPDVEKSGVAVVECGKRIIIDYSSHSFTGTIDKVTDVVRTNLECHVPVRVCVEAGWLNGGNWHISPRMSARKAAEMGRAVGRNHQAGLDLITAITRYSCITVDPVAPLVKRWRGRDGKVTHEEMKEIIGNLGGTMKSRSNQEERDALLLALCQANLPIRIKYARR